MAQKVKIGGDRLGSGNEMSEYIHGYQRSTHDLGYVWQNTQSAGTLVPFMAKIGMRGDTFDINLNADVLTHPTIGPLFASYKVQLDVFSVPIRLYQGKLHMNMLNIGMNMERVHIPQIFMSAPHLVGNKPVDNQQINPSHLMKYFGIAGLGASKMGPGEEPHLPTRKFNALKLLSYWDIYKNYYANKQEEIGYVIHNNLQELTGRLGIGELQNSNPNTVPLIRLDQGQEPQLYTVWMNEQSEMRFDMDPYQEFDISRLTLYVNGRYIPAIEFLSQWTFDEQDNTLVGTGWQGNNGDVREVGLYRLDRTSDNYAEIEPKMQPFPLSNIDEMRMDILTAVREDTPFLITSGTRMPYGQMFGNRHEGGEIVGWSQLSPNEGLGVKTYQSDLFNNWVSTEWISGENGVNAITAIDTTSGSFTIDELNLSKKVYDMLNRIALSGGTYNDWQDVNYQKGRHSAVESPMYMGGLSKELVFQEVVSQAQAQGTEGSQPLGTLAGRGVMSKKNKGGHVKIRLDEASYIIGIVSITPRISYSQGNDWDNNLETMDDIHKPAMDEIGFQDLITDQMAFFETTLDRFGVPTYKSAGKQPAWINYQTSVNEIRGNFANPANQMFMTLNRRYTNGNYADGTMYIKDLTTYIDPAKYNYIFAYARRDAQNFWVQIGVDITARRLMSARQIPNL